MTSIGFGNVAAETDNEKMFTLFMMIISSLLYAAIFGHVTTIIHNMTLATAKYHETLNSVKGLYWLWHKHFYRIEISLDVFDNKGFPFLQSSWCWTRSRERWQNGYLITLFPNGQIQKELIKKRF